MRSIGCFQWRNLNILSSVAIKRNAIYFSCLSKYCIFYIKMYVINSLTFIGLCKEVLWHSMHRPVEVNEPRRFFGGWTFLIF